MPESYTVKVRDRSPNGKPVHEIALTFDAHQVTLRDIIAERVRIEIDLFEDKAATSFANNLVQPSDAEARLRKPVRKTRFRRIDADEQIETALRAFDSNGFFVLVGDRQVVNLEDPVSLGDNPEISFVKLTRLVGG